MCSNKKKRRKITKPQNTNARLPLRAKHPNTLLEIEPAQEARRSTLKQVIPKAELVSCCRSKFLDDTGTCCVTRAVNVFGLFRFSILVE